MDFLSLACILLKTLTLTNGYVLLAANIDDFQTIAKKFGSQKFLDELVQLAKEPDFEKYKQNNHRDRTRQDSIQNLPSEKKEPELSLKETGMKIDFEELVDRVRQRLEKDFENKHYKGDKEIPEYTQNTRTTKRDAYYDQQTRVNDDDEIRDNPKYIVHESELPFKKIELAKDDSYDDYVKPAKDSSVESKENRFKVKNNKGELATVSDHSKRFNYRTKPTADIENVSSDEIKARTERLDYEESHDKHEKSGTGMPTRETYKMITPNYYVSLPTVAERYDFDEPLPERDREREHVKYIRNPPARVNKKIRIL